VFRDKQISQHCTGELGIVHQEVGRFFVKNIVRSDSNVDGNSLALNSALCVVGYF